MAEYATHLALITGSNENHAAAFDWPQPTCGLHPYPYVHNVEIKEWVMVIFPSKSEMCKWKPIVRKYCIADPSIKA